MLLYCAREFQLPALKNELENLSSNNFLTKKHLRPVDRLLKGFLFDFENLGSLKMTIIDKNVNQIFSKSNNFLFRPPKYHSHADKVLRLFSVMISHQF